MTPIHQSYVSDLVLCLQLFATFLCGKALKKSIKELFIEYGDFIEARNALFNHKYIFALTY